MDEIIRILWHQTWWSWFRPANELYFWTDIACHIFNLIEAGAWFVFAILVLCRWIRHRKSNLEVWYFIAFVLFGLSDLVEAYLLTSWLLWWKGINLFALFWLRRVIVRRFYPQSRVF